LTYRLFCEICNWKKITDGTDLGDLKDIVLSPNAPKSKKKGFKCPKCGRIVFPVKVNDPQRETDENEDIKSRREEGESNLTHPEWLKRK
jgi:hypothetical protein